jgi:tetratricopeptide (TPR) repeat protein
MREFCWASINRGKNQPKHQKHARGCSRPIRPCADILEIEPENLEARFLVADMRREKGDLEEALILYRDLADLAAASTPDLRSRVQWGLGRTALRLGKADIAVAALQEACQARPDYLPLRRSLAEALVQANLCQEALESAAAALNLAPDSVENLVWFAEFSAQQGEPEKAVEALERAVQIDPDRVDLLVDLAHRQVNAGDLQAARASLQSIAGKEPVSSRDLRRAAQIYLRLQEPVSALSYFELALQSNPVPPDLFFEVAELQERMGNTAAALELSQKAMEQNPENLSVYLLQADLLGRSHRPQAALALLERALRIVDCAKDSQRDGVGEIHERFARLLTQEENLPEALLHAEKALACSPQRADLCYQAAELALAARAARARHKNCLVISFR